jgi:hypothetical protein
MMFELCIREEFKNMGFVQVENYPEHLMNLNITLSIIIAVILIIINIIIAVRTRKSDASLFDHVWSRFLFYCLVAIPIYMILVGFGVGWYIYDRLLDYCSDESNECYVIRYVYVVEILDDNYNIVGRTYTTDYEDSIYRSRRHYDINGIRFYDKKFGGYRSIKEGHYYIIKIQDRYIDNYKYFNKE